MRTLSHSRQNDSCPSMHAFHLAFRALAFMQQYNRTDLLSVGAGPAWGACCHKRHAQRRQPSPGQRSFATHFAPCTENCSRVAWSHPPNTSRLESVIGRTRAVYTGSRQRSHPFDACNHACAELSSYPLLATHCLVPWRPRYQQ